MIMPDPGLLVDGFGRTMRYLRLSVTERCNLRCQYCRPDCRPGDGSGVGDPASRLTVTELVRLVRLFTGLGVQHVRLTGGEPLLYRPLLSLVHALGALPDLRGLALSTNASRLAGLAAPLAAAGLQRVNISLDSLDPETFRQVTRGGDLVPVLAGIDAALAAGLHPVKINMVVLGGINDHEIPAMVDFARIRGLTLRFIETMPVGIAGQTVMGTFIPAGVILQRVRDYTGLELAPVPTRNGYGPARYFHGSGTGTGMTTDIGVIAALSRYFCEDCNRVRLTSTGDLVLCLGRSDAVNLRTALRAGGTDAELQAQIQAAVRHKPRGHDFHAVGHSPQAMVRVGG